MAYIIFDKGSNNIYRIAKDQTFLNANKGFADEHMDIIEISENDFNNAKYGVTVFGSRDGATITWNTLNPAPRFNWREELTGHKNKIIEELNTWIKNESNKSKPMRDSVISYRDYLNTLDVSSIITDPSENATINESFVYSDGTPLGSSLEKYAEDQGQTAYHLLELL